MEFIGHLLLAFFIAIVVFVTLSFGFVLLMWFVAFAVAASALVMLRGRFQRLWFLYCARDAAPPKKPRKPRKPPQVIEVTYRDISDEE